MLQSWIDDKTAPSGALAKCKVCNGLLSLLLELNGDLPDHFPGHERRLYIWSCRRKACRRKEGSVRSIRGVRVAKGASAKSGAKTEKKEIKQEEEKPQPKIGESLFGVKPSASSTAPANPFSNPFSSNAGSAAPSNPFASSSAASPFAAPPAAPAIEVTPEQPKDQASATLSETFAQKARISSPAPSTPPAAPQPQEPWPAASAFPQPFPSYALDAEYETLDATAPAVPQNVRIMDIDGENGASSSSSGGKEDKEIYESAHDAVFQKFADRVGQNPEQILRYEFKGKPLLYSDADAVGKALAHAAENGSDAKVKVSGGKGGIPRCGNCGAERVFEVQLTPHAITELEAEEMSLDGMEWGTIVVGVCGRDCKPADVAEGEVGYVEEWAGVQWEEVARK